MTRCQPENKRIVCSREIVRERRSHEKCKKSRVTTLEEYSSQRSYEAGFTGVLFLLLLGLMRVRLFRPFSSDHPY